jgi:hypothetical protein
MEDEKDRMKEPRDEESFPEWLGDVRGSDVVEFLTKKLFNTNRHWNSINEIIAVARPAVEQNGNVTLGNETFAVAVWFTAHHKLDKITIVLDREPRLSTEEYLKKYGKGK